MKYIFFILCLLIYIICKLIRNYFVIQLSDLLTIISIITDIAIPFVIAYYLQNKFLVSRSLKSYHIGISDEILADYKSFINDIIKGSLNRKEISNGFKNFSIRFNSADKQNIKRFKMNVKLQPNNRALQILITGSSEYNTTQTNGKVKLKNLTITNVNLQYSKLLELNGDLIYILNK